ncbi:unnamed protein product [Prunus armeniaca]|uniref:Uncharacterized protein n=1 Tax=Prunus armeniaca TaxID=36596 RepID=A0A6J5XZ35_PRUAR|nr:unnamed protein product [Prunus armeniaca]
MSFMLWLKDLPMVELNSYSVKDSVSFSNNNCVLEPRYLEKKGDQLCKYEPHSIRAPIPTCQSKGID